MLSKDNSNERLFAAIWLFSAFVRSDFSTFL
jgi:hypothetical protein